MNTPISIYEIKVIFDDECMACNYFVRKVLTHDINNIIIFISPQSQLGQDIIVRNNLGTLYTKSIIVLNNNGDLYLKSRAIQLIIKKTRVFHNFEFIFNLIPYIFLDCFYDIFSFLRRRIPFLKNDTCDISADKSFLNRIIY